MRGRPSARRARPKGCSAVSAFVAVGASAPGLAQGLESVRNAAGELPIPGIAGGTNPTMNVIFDAPGRIGADGEMALLHQR
jgi:hypothetical protein